MNSFDRNRLLISNDRLLRRYSTNNTFYDLIMELVRKVKTASVAYIRFNPRGAQRHTGVQCL